MKRQRRKQLTLAIKTLVSLVLIAWLLSSLEWAQVAALLVKADLNWIGLALFWVIISVLVSARKWWFVCMAAGLKLPFKILWNSYWAGLFFNNFMPSSIGGDALRIYWTGKHSSDMPGAAASVIVERILATMGLSLLGIIAAVWTTTEIPYLMVFFAGLMLISIFLLSLILFPALLALLQRIFKSVPKARGFLTGLREHGARLRRRKLLLIKSLMWSVVFQFCVVLVNYSILQAFQVSQVSLPEACLVIPATSAAAMLPVGINGYGTREGAYVALFAYLGVAGAAAMTVSVVFALTVSLASLWGGLIWLREGQRPGGEDAAETSNHGESGQLLCRGL